MTPTLALALVPVVLASTSKEHTESFLGFGAPDYPAEAARAAGQDKHFAFEREVKKLEAENARKVAAAAAEANATISEGETIRRKLSVTEEVAKKIVGAEADVLWARTQTGLERLASSMAARLNESDAFMTKSREKLEAARREKAEAAARAEALRTQQEAADARRRDVVATRLALANELEALSANMTLMEEERKHALQAAAQRADAIKLEEAQYAQLEGDGAAERSSLWGLDERLRQLKTATATTLAAAAPLPALARSTKP